MKPAIVAEIPFEPNPLVCLCIGIVGHDSHHIGSIIPCLRVSDDDHTLMTVEANPAAFLISHVKDKRLFRKKRSLTVIDACTCSAI